MKPVSSQELSFQRLYIKQTILSSRTLTSSPQRGTHWLVQASFVLAWLSVTFYTSRSYFSPRSIFCNPFRTDTGPICKWLDLLFISRQGPNAALAYDSPNFATSWMCAFWKPHREPFPLCALAMSMLLYNQTFCHWKLCATAGIFKQQEYHA